jgi:hypothetical protein
MSRGGCTRDPLCFNYRLKRLGGEREVIVNGMDLVVVEGELISRNEVYFDRSLLAPLMG